MDGWILISYYITKFGRDSIINRNPGTTRTMDKWQGYLLGNYTFYWLQVWDPLWSGKEVAFMWSIWHKAVVANEWRARIAPVSISKQCVFCLPNTSKLVKHKLWDCIQAGRAWRWATFIMHELCGVGAGNYNSFIESKPCLGKGYLRNTAKRLNFGTSLGVSRSGPYGLSSMTKCSTMNNGTSLRSSTAFGMISSFMPRRLGNE